VPQTKATKSLPRPPRKTRCCAWLRGSSPDQISRKERTLDYQSALFVFCLVEGVGHGTPFCCSDSEGRHARAAGSRRGSLGELTRKIGDRDSEVVTVP
jgi:hypothetical protein